MVPPRPSCSRGHLTALVPRTSSGRRLDRPASPPWPPRHSDCHPTTPFPSPEGPHRPPGRRLRRFHRPGRRDGRRHAGALRRRCRCFPAHHHGLRCTSRRPVPRLPDGPQRPRRVPRCGHHRWRAQLSPVDRPGPSPRADRLPSRRCGNRPLNRPAGKHHNQGGRTQPPPDGGDHPQLRRHRQPPALGPPHRIPA